MRDEGGMSKRMGRGGEGKEKKEVVKRRLLSRPVRE